MNRPRVTVGFSNADIQYYRLMQSWKNREALDFEFFDCQFGSAPDDDEASIKNIFRDRICRASSYLLLISANTRSDRLALWETEMALEKGCNIVGVNLDGSRTMDPAKCPAVIQNVGTIFVPFSPQIIAYAVKHPHHRNHGDWTFTDVVYRSLGYNFAGTLAQCARGATSLPSSSRKSIKAPADESWRTSKPRPRTPPPLPRGARGRLH